MRAVYLVLVLFILSACGKTIGGLHRAVNSVNDTPGKMDVMTARMNELERLTKLATAKQNLEDEKNAWALEPIPFGLMPYAKIFAESANLDELTAQFYLYENEVNEGMPQPSVDASGVPLAFTPDQVAKINQHKMARLTAMQAIAAFLPDTMIDELILHEVQGEGQYRETVLALFMMRVKFDRTVIMDNKLLAQEMTSLGVLVEANKYLNDIEKMINLPFASELKYDFYGFLPPVKPDQLQMTPAYAKETMVTLINKIKAKAKPLKTMKVVSWSADEKVNLLQSEKNQAMASQILADLENKLKFWKAK